MLIQAEHFQVHRGDPGDIGQLVERHVGGDEQALVTRQQVHQRRLFVAVAIQRLAREVNLAVARAVDHRLDGGASEQGLQIAWRQVGHGFHVRRAGEAGGQLGGDIGQRLAGFHLGLAGLQEELHITVVGHADELGVG
ncbi:hypothetical protein D3C79_945700 [compost metagenome]